MFGLSMVAEINKKPKFLSKVLTQIQINGGINNKTCLPNRLYNAAIYGKPMLAFEGTYLSGIIKEYNLGLIIEDFDNIEEELMEYVNNFKLEPYENGRNLFFETVIKENKKFFTNIREFMHESQK